MSGIGSVQQNTQIPAFPQAPLNSDFQLASAAVAPAPALPLLIEALRYGGAVALQAFQAALATAVTGAKAGGAMATAAVATTTVILSGALISLTQGSGGVASEEELVARTNLAMSLAELHPNLLRFDGITLKDVNGVEIMTRDNRGSLVFNPNIEPSTLSDYLNGISPIVVQEGGRSLPAPEGDHSLDDIIRPDGVRPDLPKGDSTVADPLPPTQPEPVDPRDSILRNVPPRVDLPPHTGHPRETNPDVEKYLYTSPLGGEQIPMPNLPGLSPGESLDIYDVLLDYLENPVTPNVGAPGATDLIVQALHDLGITRVAIAEVDGDEFKAYNHLNGMLAADAGLAVMTDIAALSLQQAQALHPDSFFMGFRDGGTTLNSSPAALRQQRRCRRS